MSSPAKIAHERPPCTIPVPDAASGNPTMTDASPVLPLPTVTLMGVQLHAIRQQECVAHVLAELAAGRGSLVATANLDHLRRLQQDAPFQAAYQKATLVVADGMPLVWACHLQGTPIPERVAGSDLIHSLTAGAAAAGRSVFLLGGDPGTAEAAAAQLKALYPGLHIAGTCCPPFGFERDPARLQEVLAQVRSSAADIVYVALGSPKQELLIAAVHTTLPQACWIGVGISFSFVSGEVQRAPRWLQRLGLEWVHRLVQEPRRLWTRYLVHGLPFALRLFASALRQRWRKPAR
jgi:N-acetylglucosaminyldiphosphoundecaprenol N-acetyl-beta-D-mannosaminyltransferase